MEPDLKSKTELFESEASPRRKRPGMTGSNTREFCCGLAVITVLGMVASMRSGPSEGMAASQIETQKPSRAAMSVTPHSESAAPKNDPMRSAQKSASAQEKTRSE